MVSGYASLQLALDGEMEAAGERLVYAVTSIMDKGGLVPCDRGSAERTVAFVRTEKGFALFDDCADRLDIVALDQLGRGLTRRLHTRGVGIMCAGDGMMLRLYGEGYLRDAYLSARGAFVKKHGFFWFRCHGRAMRWRRQLAAGYTRKELADAFARGDQGGRAVFSELRLLLGLDDTADFGFASIESAGLQGVVTLYFRAANRVRPGLFGRMARQAAKQAASGAGVYLGPPASEKCSRCGRRESGK